MIWTLGEAMLALAVRARADALQQLQVLLGATIACRSALIRGRHSVVFVRCHT